MLGVVPFFLGSHKDIGQSYNFSLAAVWKSTTVMQPRFFTGSSPMVICVCFGNATMVLLQAVSEFRVPKFHGEITYDPPPCACMQTEPFVLLVAGFFL